MHERGVASDLVRAAGVVAVNEGAIRVRSIRVQIGGLSHIDPDSLAAQVSWHAQGTIVEGARVIVQREAMAEGAMPAEEDEQVTLLSVDLEE